MLNITPTDTVQLHSYYSEIGTQSVDRCPLLKVWRDFPCPPMNLSEKDFFTDFCMRV